MLLPRHEFLKRGVMEMFWLFLGGAGSALGSPRTVSPIRSNLSPIEMI